jgi:hypothetical protein
VTPIAALLFSSIWSVIYYSFEIMPNEWVAVTALASCGYLLLFLKEGRAPHVIAASVALGLVAFSSAARRRIRRARAGRGCY